MAIDNKYGRVSFEEPNTIGEDEPVVVFRAADPLTPAALNEYYNLCEAAGAPQQHRAAITRATQGVQLWQQEHPELVRELPTSSNWDGVDRV